MDKQKTEQQQANDQKTPRQSSRLPGIMPPRLVSLIADEVAKTLVKRLPGIMPRQNRKKKAAKKSKKIEQGIFLDTSAIIDGRIFDVIHTGLLNGIIVIPESVLLELKHIADSQDAVRRERGRRGLEDLEKIRKARDLKLIILPEQIELEDMKKRQEVDERLIKSAKQHKGKIITCDYNLEKKATIENVTAINMNALANTLKVTAVPGESLHIKVLHPGKDSTQGVGYLDDGTMIVVENGSTEVATTIDVVVSRVIQTATGRILFAKKI